MDGLGGFAVAEDGSGASVELVLDGLDVFGDVDGQVDLTSSG